MKSEDFMDFSGVAQQAQYLRVPFTKIKSLLFEAKEPRALKYKTAFTNEWIVVTILDRKTTRGGAVAGSFFEVRNPTIAKSAGDLNPSKKADIKSMLKFMPLTDKIFMSNIIK